MVRWIGWPRDSADVESETDADPEDQTAEDTAPRRVRAMPIGFRTGRGPDCVDAPTSSKVPCETPTPYIIATGVKPD